MINKIMKKTTKKWILLLMKRMMMRLYIESSLQPKLQESVLKKIWSCSPIESVCLDRKKVKHLGKLIKRGKRQLKSYIKEEEIWTHSKRRICVCKWDWMKKPKWPYSIRHKRRSRRWKSMRISERTATKWSRMSVTPRKRRHKQRTFSITKITNMWPRLPWSNS